MMPSLFPFPSPLSFPLSFPSPSPPFLLSLSHSIPLPTFAVFLPFPSLPFPTLPSFSSTYLPSPSLSLPLKFGQEARGALKLPEWGMGQQ